MKSLIHRTSTYFKNHHIGLLLIRIGTGLVFFMHGWGKVDNIPGVEGMFAHMGLGAGVAVFIAWLEVIGGLALIIGIATRFFAAAFAIQMLVAIFLTGGVANGYKPHELELYLMLMSAGIALSGSGRYALFSLECTECGGWLCDTHNK